MRYPYCHGWLKERRLLLQRPLQTPGTQHDSSCIAGGIRLKPDGPRMPQPVVCEPLEIALSSDRRFKKRFARRIVLDFTKGKKKKENKG